MKRGGCKAEKEPQITTSAMAANLRRRVTHETNGGALDFPKYISPFPKSVGTNECNIVFVGVNFLDKKDEISRARIHQLRQRAEV